MLLLILLLLCSSAFADQAWTQWGKDAQHNGQIDVAGQTPDRILAKKLYDLNAQAEKRTERELLVHYQAILLDADDVFMEFKGGKFQGSTKSETQEWSERGFQWKNGKLVERWRFVSDWKPVPFGLLGGGPPWEPVFHAALAGDFIYIPGFGGTIYKVSRADGQLVARLNPFGSKINAHIFVAGPLSVFQDTVYYNAIQLNGKHPWTKDVVNSWLVKISPDEKISKVSYASLTPGAPKATDTCGTDVCGSQRPGINIAPAISSNGTIYTISRSHFNQAYGYLIAVRSNLTTRWISSLRVHINDIEPEDRQAGRVVDISSASPVVTPDGSILYGALTRLLKFSRKGKFQSAYSFGWDITPAIYTHDGTYSIVIKDNDYAGEQYYITQLNPNLEVEWRYKNTNTLSCKRNRDGSITCKDDHPNSFEWCINAPAIDKHGNVYVNSEDGNLYVIQQGGKLRQKIFLQLAIGAAYTPLSIDSQGRIYTQNFGRLFVIGKN